MQADSANPPGYIQETFGSLISQTQRQWRRAVDRKLQPLGLTEASWLALVSLARAREPMRQKDLAAALSLDSSSVVRLLDNLQAAGFIDRNAHEDDRRAYTVVLTAQGQETERQVQAVAEQVRRKILGSVPAEDLAVAHRVLKQLLGTLESAAAQAAGPAKASD